MNKIPKPELIRIAVTGHTNSGKTTMIQTLMKQKIGEIDDRANVTKDVQLAPYEYDFIDTPGFQQANTLLLVKKDVIELDSELEKELEYEMKAFKAIESSDVILYVVSLETVPERSHEKEIELIVSTQKGVVALLNKGISLSQPTTDSDAVAKQTTRIERWKDVLHNCGVSKSFVFDAHSHDPGRVVEIYSAIKECLPTNKKSLFEREKVVSDISNPYKVGEMSEIAFEKPADTEFDRLSADEKPIITRPPKNLSELNKVPLANIANTEPNANFSGLSSLSLTQSRKRELGKIVSDLSNLYEAGEISETDFEKLAEYASKSFVEAEIEKRLGSYLEQKLIKLSERLTSDKSILQLLEVSKER
ncbi:MAG: hypothetical protein F6K40_20235 [Okeania sp. SIO3I5]|uniref:GTPase n=1 Tax=Okeania sp. SIO3I5 TaxID=2607805 RepID=UPI0013BAF7E8|nr:GTPase [Okeania sp. SIO3I5]NEQ38469.1 hypothetical protein [Okeania sp. SIO3I5]